MYRPGSATQRMQSWTGSRTRVSPKYHLQRAFPSHAMSSGSCLCRPSSAAYGRQRSSVPTLQRLCEQTVARQMVEPRSALALLEFADAAGAQLLRQHSLAVSHPLLCMRSGKPENVSAYRI